MVKFRTEIDIPKQEQQIPYHSHMLFMGSCFATNIGNYFSEMNFNALVNPFGVLYNPFSIAKSLERLSDATTYSENDLVHHNSTWQSFDHHGSFNHSNKENCLNHINKTLEEGARFLKKTNVLFITFGTSWIYELKDSQQVVSNCHKWPASYFNRSLSNVKDIVDKYSIVFKRLQSDNPDLKIILTVSPVRHWKDGAHGNQLSKAILLLAIEELCANFNNVSYFPAYELLLDDLRDYRYFDNDMLHPSPMAVEYIREKFILSWLDNHAHIFNKKIGKLITAAKHRPFDPTSIPHQEFLKKNITILQQIKNEYPKVNLSQLFTFYNSKLC